MSILDVFFPPLKTWIKSEIGRLIHILINNFDLVVHSQLEVEDSKHNRRNPKVSQEFMFW